MADEPATSDGERRRLAVDAWLGSASADLAAARALLGHDEEGVEASSVAFHAQQAAEKAIKAILIRERLPVPPRHDIGVLLNALPDSGRSQFDGRATRLTKYAAGVRYPAGIDDPMNLGEEVSWAEAQEALAIAESVVAVAVGSMTPQPSAYDPGGPRRRGP